MCPEKETAVAEAPESPPVGPADAPVAPDPGTPATEPLAPQEPSGEEESGAEEGEEAGVEQPPEPTFWEAQERLLKENPEFRAEAEKHGWVSQELRDRLQEPTEDKADWQAAQERQGSLRKASEVAASYSPQSVQQGVKGWADTLAKNVRDAAGDLQQTPENTDGTRRSAELLDADDVAGFLTEHIQRAGYAWMDWANQTNLDTVLTALEGHSAHKHLTTEDKAARKEGAGKPVAERLASVVNLYLGAALRAAPADFKTKTEAELKKSLGFAKAMDELTAKLPQNGRRVTEGANPSGTSYSTLAEAHVLHGQRKISNQEMRAAIARFSK